MQNVSPMCMHYTPVDLSLQLLAAGLTNQTACFWIGPKDFANLPKLYSRLGDPDNLYADFDGIQKVESAAVKVPAYSITELLSIIPDFMLTSTNNMYEVMTPIYGGESIYIQDKSLAVAVASLVLTMITRKLIDLPKANEQLHYKTIYPLT